MLTSFITLAFVLSALASLYKRDTILSVSLSGPSTNVTSVGDLSSRLLWPTVAQSQ